MVDCSLKLETKWTLLSLNCLSEQWESFLQVSVLGFEDNFAFHFNKEGGANLHDICPVLTDYHSLNLHICPLPIGYHTLSSLFCTQIGQFCPVFHKCNFIYFSWESWEINANVLISYWKPISSHIIGNNDSALHTALFLPKQWLHIPQHHQHLWCYKAQAHCF